MFGPNWRFQEMWRRKLKLSALLALLMAGLWLLQGYQGADPGMRTCLLHAIDQRNGMKQC